ncbi:MAG: DUF4031 domain-containing protein [Pseudomonadota bacterium]
MAVYVDNMRASYGRMKMCHMVADSIAELLEMADKIGVDRKWFQPGSSPHFDISLSKRALAVRAGAIEVGRHELVAAIKRYRELWRSDPAELEAIRAAARAATPMRKLPGNGLNTD